MSGTRGRAMLALSVLAVLAGGVAALAGAGWSAELVWAGATLAVSARLAVDIVADLRRRRAGVDVIALLAMLGALALGEHLAGAVVAVMLTGGQALEEHAAGRARRELTALLAAAPREAHRVIDDHVETIPVPAVVPGDLLLVRAGEVVPVDAVVVDRVGLFDESTLTGEARPVPRRTHTRVGSGAVNAGPPVRMRAVTTAEAGTYAGIVALVRQAAQARTPFTRLADRYALAFVPLTLLVSGAAWVASGEAVRALAVLVVATPCPLILAAPVALVSGVSVAARRGIIVKDAAALERLAGATTVLFDKTGTLTTGTPRVAEAVVAPGTSLQRLLRAAGSLEQASSHVYADAIITAARRRGATLTFPTDVVERPGVGIAGRIDDAHVTLGSVAWVAPDVPRPAPIDAALRRARLEGGAAVAVAIDGAVAGVFLLDDPIRPEAGRVVRSLRAGGVTRVAMLTGDDPEVAAIVARALGLDDVRAGLSAADKVTAVRTSSGTAGTTVMVGDGVNDAPALAAADMGVAMGARGATASSEAADVVITVDRLDRLIEGVRIARWSRRVATESVLVGMGLSLLAMAFAAAGALAPLVGAVVQEAIDVAAILNALRALRLPGAGAVSSVDRRAGARYRRQHHALWAGVDEIRAVADRLDWMSSDDARRDLSGVRAFLVDDLLPHERAEERRLYPRLAAVADGVDPTAPLVGTHREIERLVGQFDRLVTDLQDEGPSVGDRLDLRRLLYGLHAILHLHIAQEEELYLGLDDGASDVQPGSAAVGDLAQR